MLSSGKSQADDDECNKQLVRLLTPITMKPTKSKTIFE